MNQSFETCPQLKDSLGLSTLDRQTTLWLFKETIKQTRSPIGWRPNQEESS